MMPREPRVAFSGAIYHVTSRGNNKQDIFLSDEDRVIFFDTLAKTVKQLNWVCYAYCLMKNHYHLLIETPDGNISQGMHKLNMNYSRRFKNRYQTVGHLFQSRFTASLLKEEIYLLEVIRYIVLNPVRAEIVKKPENYIWSSYLATIKKRPHPKFLNTKKVLEQFWGCSEAKAIELYIHFVEQGIKQK